MLYWSNSECHLFALLEHPSLSLPFFSVTTVLSLWVILSCRKGDIYSRIAAPLKALNIPHLTVGASVTAALTTVGIAQITISVSILCTLVHTSLTAKSNSTLPHTWQTLYFWLAVALESASANVIAFAVNMAFFTELTISALAVWNKSGLPLSSLVFNVTPGMAVLALLFLGTFWSLVSIGQRLAFANAMSK